MDRDEFFQVLADYTAELLTASLRHFPTNHIDVVDVDEATPVPGSLKMSDYTDALSTSVWMSPLMEGKLGVAIGRCAPVLNKAVDELAKLIAIEGPEQIFMDLELPEGVDSRAIGKTSKVSVRLVRVYDIERDVFALRVGCAHFKRQMAQAA